MSTVAQQPQAHPSRIPQSTAAPNGHGELPESPLSSGPQPPANPVPTAKKGKGKKAADPNETGKLLAAKISQLELDAAGEKDQEAEIGALYNIMSGFETQRRTAF